MLDEWDQTMDTPMSRINRDMSEPRAEGNN